MARNFLSRTDMTDTSPEARSSAGEIAAFLDRARKPKGQGRLIFALDATMSRQPTWDRAMHLQSGMFDAAAGLGTLDIQLVYFRGFKECRASRWVSNADGLRGLMERIECRGGQTQIGKVLKHAVKERRAGGASALVFIGDAMEEKVDALCQTAGELGMLKVPCFMVQEGRDADTERAYREIARLSGGAHVRLDGTSAGRLKDWLAAIATWSTGGVDALRRLGTGEARHLLESMER